MHSAHGFDTEYRNPNAINLIINNAEILQLDNVAQEDEEKVNRSLVLKNF